MSDFPLSKKMIRNIFTGEFLTISFLFLTIGLQSIQWFSAQQAELAMKSMVFQESFILQTNAMISLFFIFSMLFFAGSYYIYRNIEQVID
ncbi:MAG: hypothetical protein J7K00_01250 [Candidatus Diapherotrites archaeon]|nr:hypothetical protein [Candidatus Diapherotrites archaeon]